MQVQVVERVESGERILEYWHCPQPARYRVLRDHWRDVEGHLVRHVYEVEEVPDERHTAQ